MKISNLSKEQQALVFSKLALDESNYTKLAQTDVVKLGHVLDIVRDKIKPPSLDVDKFINETDSDELFELFTELALKKSTWKTFFKQNVNNLDKCFDIFINADIEMDEAMRKNHINKLFENFMISLSNENYLTMKINKDLVYQVFNVRLSSDIDIEKQLENLTGKEIDIIEQLVIATDVEDAIKMINESIYRFKLLN